MAKKCFTVGYQTDAAYRSDAAPFIRFGGKWLKDFGFSVGDKLQLVQGKNMIILMKVSKADKGAGL